MASSSSSDDTDEDDQVFKKSSPGIRYYSSNSDNDNEEEEEGDHNNKNLKINQEPADFNDISSSSSSSDEEDNTNASALPKKKATIVDSSGDDSNDSDTNIISDNNEDEELPTKEKSRKRKITALEDSDSESNSDVNPGSNKVEIPFDQDDDDDDLESSPDEPDEIKEDQGSNKANKPGTSSSKDDDDGHDGGPQMYDFDIMMQRTKEERRILHNKRRKGSKDIEMINDNDDAIARLLADMRLAAHEDRELNLKGEPATKKLAMLNAVKLTLAKVDLRLAFVEANILSVITDWLAPLPRDKSLPSLPLREILLQFLYDVPIDDYSRLKESGVGKAVMYMYRHPKQTRTLKDLCKNIIHKWSRPIFQISCDFSAMSKEERVARDRQMADRVSAAQSSARRRAKFEAEMEREKELRPGDAGWIGRARVPMVDTREYVKRPEWQSNVDFKEKQVKKGISMYEKHKRKFADKARILKGGHSVKISIEGKNM